jgi:hypothetical protein
VWTYHATGPETIAAPSLRWQGGLGPIGVGSVKYDGTTRYQIVAKHSGKCVSVFDGTVGGSTVEHTPVNQRSCAAGYLNEQFTLELRGAAYVRLRPAHAPGKCLNVSGGVTTNEAPLISSTCTPGQSNESWQIEYVTGSTSTPNDPNELAIRFVTNLSGKCMDIRYASMVDGGVAQQFECIPQHANETYYLRRVPATSNGLLAQWTMGGTATNSVLADTTGRDATAVVNAHPTNLQSSGVLTLNGTTGFARTAGPVINTSASFTVSGWAKLDVVGGRFQSIVAQEGSNMSAFYLSCNPSGKWIMQVLNGINGGTYTAAVATSAASAVAGTWVHLVGVYDSSAAQVRLYVNGVADGVNSVPAGVAASGQLVIGGALSFAGRVDYVDGSIDDVRAYERALTPAEISALYSAGAS